jgi:ankyrin repeat protein
MGTDINAQNRDTSRYANGSWVIRSSDVDYQLPVPEMHQTPVHLAVERGDVEALQALLRQQPDLSVRNSAGMMPLHAALEAQEEELVVQLLQVLMHVETWLGWDVFACFEERVGE